jgi:hypothetical protein
MEDRVFNRSLFQKKTAARDKLRELGGIMASSEPLLQEAVRTITQGEQPRPQANPMLGIMAMRQQAPGMMGQPMMGQPMMPAMMAPQMPAMMPPPAQPQPQRPPMMAPAPAPQQAPMQQPQGTPPMQQPMQQPQPPQGTPLNPMQQGQGRIGFQQGGSVEGLMGVPPQRLPQGPARIDVARTAGTVVSPVNIEQMSVADAYNLGSSALSGQPVSIPQFRQEDVGEDADALNDYSRRVVSSVANPNISEEDRARLLTSAMGGNARADNIAKELASTASKTFDKEIDSNTKIDALNRAIMGFAIASGTSARATQNVANGMLVGLNAMRETEQGRVDAAEARAAAAARGSGRSTTTVTDNMRRDLMRNISANPSNYGIDTYGTPQETGEAIATLIDRIMESAATSNQQTTQGGGGTGTGGGTMSSVVNEAPTTPGTVYRDLTSGEVMIVGEDGTPQPYEEG